MPISSLGMPIRRNQTLNGTDGSAATEWPCKDAGCKMDAGCKPLGMLGQCIRTSSRYNAFVQMSTYVTNRCISPGRSNSRQSRRATSKLQHSGAYMGGMNAPLTYSRSM